MKKIFTSCFVMSSLVLQPALRADEPAAQQAPATLQADMPANQEGTPVGQAASEGSNTARRKRWQNIAIAAAAIAIAVTALILVANNDGHD